MSQLSDAMRTRLGPQTPGVEGRPRVATAQEIYPGSLATAVMPDWPPHPPAQPHVRLLVESGPFGSISRRLDDMLSTHFRPYIIEYEPPRGFIVSKFTTYDETRELFDHIMHYRQLMTLDIRNDALLCKVFPAILHDQTLSWFHRLLKNSMSNFWDLSEAFMGHYLCSTRHKHNISTLQNIKIQENESLRELVKRFE